MEYMKLEGFLGRMVGNVINKVAKEKTGVNPYIELKNFSVETDDTEEWVKVKMTAMVPKESFEKLVEEVTK